MDYQMAGKLAFVAAGAHSIGLDIGGTIRGLV